ncbi:MULTISPECIES: hypothetical protein [Cyanophyceae]|nr:MULTISPECIES: hypothetical protein [unclassified Picosynechococcus]
MATTHNVMGNPSQSKKLNPQSLTNQMKKMIYAASVRRSPF